MNATAEVLSGKALDDAIEVLEIRALVRAYLEYEHQYEHLADAVDPLQESAERSGLVAAIGQDAVQAIIAAPFERFRAIVAHTIDTEEQACAEAEFDPESDKSDFRSSVDDVLRRWELADPRDRWKHTGEVPPAIPDIPKPPRPYSTPISVADAFWSLVLQNDLDYLANWLKQHPADAPHLHELWGRKCSTAAA